MVPEIVVKNGKFLIAKQVILIPADNITNLGVLIESSITKLKAYGLSPTGPPIIWEKIDFDGKAVILGRKIILQCSGNASKIPTGFERKERLKIGPCIYTRFIGKEENAIYASQKISVYAYENEIGLKKESYTVYVKKNNDMATIDLFVPLED